MIVAYNICKVYSFMVHVKDIWHFLEQARTSTGKMWVYMNLLSVLWCCSNKC